MGAWAEDNHRTRVDPLYRPVNETVTDMRIADHDGNTNEETSLEEDGGDEDRDDRDGDSFHLLPEEG